MRKTQQPLDDFFNKGNKIAVFGSFLYLPESACDIDFTLFTSHGKNPFSCSPEYSEEIRKFFTDTFGEFDLKMDFTGRNMTHSPYDLSHLPKSDLRLDGYLLAGSFFPDDGFLEEHYKNMFGNDFLIDAWKRYSECILDFQSQEERVDKRHKDIALLLYSTEKLAKNNSRVRRVIESYRQKYNVLNKQKFSRKISETDYERETSDLVPSFVSLMSSLI